MPPITVLIVSRDADAYREHLASRVAPDTRLLVGGDPEALPEAAGEATVALGEPDRLAAVLPGLAGITWVQSTWAGITPLLPAARKGVRVTGVKDVFGAQMAEYVLGHALSRVLDLPARRAAQAERRWLPTATGSLAGQTLGVMGTGSIGTVVAERATALGLRVIGYSRSGAARKPFEAVYGHASLHDFLGRCHWLVGVLPDTPDTRGLLDAAAFEALPRGAVLVNVGRGSLVDDEALVAALRSRHLGGAVLDVFREEPLPPDHPFWDAPGLDLTAHVAARSVPREIAAIFADNLARYQEGRALRYLVDADRGY